MIMMGTSIRQIWVTVSISLNEQEQQMADLFNPYLTNGFSHYYQLGESTFVFRGVRRDFKILFNFSMKSL